MRKLTQKLQDSGYRNMVQKGGRKIIAKQRLQSAAKPKRGSLLQNQTTKANTRNKAMFENTYHFFTPTSYDVNEHEKFCNLTMYLNDYQKKMREGAARDLSSKARTRNENRDKTLDLDFKSYTHMKAFKSTNTYKSEQKASNSCLMFTFRLDGVSQETQETTGGT